MTSENQTAQNQGETNPSFFYVAKTSLKANVLSYEFISPPFDCQEQAEAFMDSMPDVRGCLIYHAAQYVPFTPNTTDKTPSLGRVCASNAMHVLYEKAKPHLTEHKLNHLSNLDDLVTSELLNVQEHLEALGGFFCNTAKFDAPAADSIGFMFYGLAHQLDTIAVLMNISESAACQLEQRKAGKGGSHE